MKVCRKCNEPANSDSKLCRACGAILEVVEDAAEKPRLIAAPPQADPGRPGEAPPLAHRTLGLPSGSIRALLTLLIVAVVVVQLARGQDIEILWTETLMIALAHYFTSRRFVNLPPEIVRQLTAEGHIDPETRPLYLPKHSIRVILFLSFVGVTVYLYLYRQDLLFRQQALSILGVVFAYFLGIVTRLKARGWEDLKALVVLVVLVIVAAAYLTDQAQSVPHALRTATLALVLYYFGSR